MKCLCGAKKRCSSLSLSFSLCVQIRHGAGTGLREVLKCHGAGGGKMVSSTAEQVFIGLQIMIRDQRYREFQCLMFYSLFSDGSAASGMAGGSGHQASLRLCSGQIWRLCVG